jgi:hypothetical protein
MGTGACGKATFSGAIFRGHTRSSVAAASGWPSGSMRWSSKQGDAGSNPATGREFFHLYPLDPCFGMVVSKRSKIILVPLVVSVKSPKGTLVQDLESRNTRHVVASDLISSIYVAARWQPTQQIQLSLISYLIAIAAAFGQNLPNHYNVLNTLPFSSLLRITYLCSDLDADVCKPVLDATSVNYWCAVFVWLVLQET